MLQFFSILTIVLLVCIDQLIKGIILLWLKPLQSVSLIPEVLSLTYVENRGAAFGVFQGSAVVMGILSCFIFIGGLYLLFSRSLDRKFSLNKLNIGLSYAALILIMGGGLGNFIDRIFRQYVIDFIELKFIRFPVFNFADCLITVGILLFIVWTVRYCIEVKKLEDQQKRQAEARND